MLKMSAAAQRVGTAAGASLIAILLSSAVASANPPTPNPHNTEGVVASDEAKTLHPAGQVVKTFVPSATFALTVANGGNNNGVGPVKNTK
jgi:hypothetical protein